jgi:hypothetical protein
MALPISDNSMKRTRRTGFDGAGLKTFQTLSQMLASAHSGTPAQKSMLRMVLTFIGIMPGFALACARRIPLFPEMILTLRDRRSALVVHLLGVASAALF